MKRLLLIALFTFSLSAKEENVEHRLSCLEKAIKCQNRSYPALKNKHSVYVTADYLYWLAEENGLAYATSIVHNPTTGENKGQVQNLNFGWDSGFRTGLGYRMAHDHWELFANWTHFITSADAQISTLAQLYPEWASMVKPTSSHPVTYLDARWNLTLNLLDGEIARIFQATRSLSLRPHLGLRGAWIGQSYKTNLSGGQNGAVIIYADNIKMTNDFRGIGFRASLDTEWALYRRFSFYGNLGGALLYGSFHVRRVEEQSTSVFLPLSTAIDIADDFHRLVPTADIALGFRWDHTFARRIALRLQAGWEFNDFFSQNNFEHLLLSENSTYSFIANDADLTTQGLTLSARLDF